MPRKTVAYAICMALMYAVFAWAMAYYTSFLPTFSAASLDALIRGRAHLPYQYRILGPFVVGSIKGALDLSTRQAELLFYVLAYAFAFVAFRAWLKLFLPARAADAAPLWLSATLFNNLMLRYPWDVLSLAFLTCLLMLIYKRSWALFLVVLAVATLNRETTYLAILALVVVELFYRKSPAGRTLALAAAAAVVWFAVKFALNAAFAGNPGGGVEWSLPENLQILRCETCYMDFSASSALKSLCFTFPLCWLQVLSVANFAWLLIFPAFSRKSPLLKWLLVLVPFQLALIMLFGTVAERRVYIDLYPVIIPLALQTFFTGNGAHANLNADED